MYIPSLLKSRSLSVDGLFHMRIKILSTSPLPLI